MWQSIGEGGEVSPGSYMFVVGAGLVVLLVLLHNRWLIGKASLDVDHE